MFYICDRKISRSFLFALRGVSLLSSVNHPNISAKTGFPYIEVLIHKLLYDWGK